MRILLAEDDRIIAQGLVAALRKSGYAIDHVGNGIDADTALLSQQYDLVILDLGLPRLPGIEVLKRLRARKVVTPIWENPSSRAQSRIMRGPMRWARRACRRRSGW